MYITRSECRALGRIVPLPLAMEPTSRRVAIVTGSARGIGYAIAHRLADDGVDVVINDLSSNQDKIDEVVEEIKKKGRRSIGIAADISKEDEVRAMLDKAVEELGSLDVVSAYS